MTAPSSASVERLAPALLGRPDVVAVGGGTVVRAGHRLDDPCLTVFVVRKLARERVPRQQMLPRTVSDEAGGRIMVDVVEAGRLTAPPPLRKLAAPAGESRALRSRVRPARGGVSAANARFPVGTAAAAVVDSRGGPPLALSCNHVFGEMGGASPGEPILQPAALDGGSAVDVLGTLSRSAPLALDGTTPQRVDAAVAACFPDVLAPGIAGGGAVSGVRNPVELRPGAVVHKTGRSTGYTEGRVLAVHVWTKIDYSFLGFPGRVVLYRDQIATTGMGAYGDSGSLLLDATDHAVGLLFSGADGTTLHNPIPAVLATLQIAFGPPQLIDSPRE